MSARQAGERYDRGVWARRHNHALVSMARRVWQRDCGLQDALAVICETAAHTLEVERVNVWRIRDDARVLQCVHHYERATGKHHVAGLPTLAIGPAYAEALDEVRVVDFVAAGRFEID